MKSCRKKSKVRSRCSYQEKHGRRQKIFQQEENLLKLLLKISRRGQSLDFCRSAWSKLKNFVFQEGATAPPCPPLPTPMTRSQYALQINGFEHCGYSGAWLKILANLYMQNYCRYKSPSSKRSQRMSWRRTYHVSACTKQPRVCLTRTLYSSGRLRTNTLWLKWALLMPL